MSHDPLITDLRAAFTAQAAQLPGAGEQPRHRPRTRPGALVTTGAALAGVAIAIAVAATNTAGPDPASPAVAAPGTSPTTAPPAEERVTLELAGHQLTLPPGYRLDATQCANEPLPHLIWPGTIFARVPGVAGEDGTCLIFVLNENAVAAPANGEPVTVDGLEGWTTTDEFGRLVAVLLPDGYTMIVQVSSTGAQPSLEDALAIVDSFDLANWVNVDDN